MMWQKERFKHPFLLGCGKKRGSKQILRVPKQGNVNENISAQVLIERTF